MDHATGDTGRLCGRLASALDGDDWNLEHDGEDTERVRIEFSDRTVVVDRHDGPDGEPRWSLTLRVGGETVSKFGRYETVEAVRERVTALQRTEVRYTVCCDGERSGSTR